MKYNEFRDKAFAEIMNYMPEEYADYSIKIERVAKVNNTKECFHIRPDSVTSVVPNIYVDDLYNVYMRGKSFEETMRMAAQFYADGVEFGKSFSFGADGAISPDNIVFQLVNTSRNMELIKRVPHRSWLNLTLIYRAVIDADDDGFYSTVVTDDLANSRRWNEEDLYSFAMENTQRLLPACVLEITDVFNVLTNAHKIMGAGTVLYDNVLGEIAELLDDDLYLIPSSIHEMLAVPVCDNSAENLNGILRECNSTVVDDSEILSDTIYCYQKDMGRVVIA